MATPKRRKPGDMTARLESQAAAAWARENARITAREVSDKARRDEKAAEEREVAAGHAEAEAITQSLQSRLTELETLLASTLGEDPYLPVRAAKGTSAPGRHPVHRAAHFRGRGRRCPCPHLLRPPRPGPRRRRSARPLRRRLRLRRVHRTVRAQRRHQPAPLGHRAGRLRDRRGHRPHLRRTRSARPSRPAPGAPQSGATGKPPSRGHLIPTWQRAVQVNDLDHPPERSRGSPNRTFRRGVKHHRTDVDQPFPGERDQVSSPARLTVHPHQIVRCATSSASASHQASAGATTGSRLRSG